MNPNEIVNNAIEKQKKLRKQLIRAMENAFTEKEKDFSHLVSKLEALSPLKIMDRGYSLVYSNQNILIKNVKQIKKNEELKIKVSDGAFTCQVTDIEE